MSADPNDQMTDEQFAKFKDILETDGLAGWWRLIGGIIEGETVTGKTVRIDPDGRTTWLEQS